MKEKLIALSLFLTCSVLFSSVTLANDDINIEADLSIVLTLSGKTFDGKLQAINCTLDYEWKKIPVNRLQDPITVTIDSTDYRIDYDSFEKVDKYVYRDYNNQRNAKIKSSETTAASMDKHGVSWYADLAGGVVDELYGYGKFTINAENTTATGAMDINFMYGHATVTIPIPKMGESFSISGGDSSDQFSGSKYVTWYNGTIH